MMRDNAKDVASAPWLTGREVKQGRDNRAVPLEGSHHGRSILDLLS